VPFRLVGHENSGIDMKTIASISAGLRGLVLMLVMLPIAAPGCAQQPSSAADAEATRARLLAEDVPALHPLAAPPPLQDPVGDSRRNAIVTAAERVSPAVVSISVVRRERVVPRSLIEQMLMPPGQERQSAGMGSGFILHADGLVLTNEHVIRGATEVLVTLPDGREFDADLVGTDDVNDLAVLRIRLPESGRVPLPVAPLGTSDGLLIGEWVIAIGNPLGNLLSNTEPSVTVGVVSAVRRNILPAGGDQRGFYLDMIQTDASINPGNSGGPLVNAHGEVIGVNSSILTSSGGSEGLGFAIPIDRACRIVNDLVGDGRVRRAWIGADVEPLQSPGLRRGQEVRVAQVAPGSPAARAGLRPGMTVREVAGRRIRNPLDWEAAVLSGRVGQPLAVRVAAEDRERVLQVVPEDLPSVSAERIQALREFQLVTLTPAIRAERGVVNEQGALIVDLSDQARSLGFRPGDLILQINTTRIRSAEEAARALRELGGRGVVMYFERNGTLGSIRFTVR
jgi:serine protease Do